MDDFRAAPGDTLPDEVTLAQAVGWFETVYLPGCKLAERTQAEYHADVVQLIGFLRERGILRVAAVRRTHLEAFLMALEPRPSQRRKVFALKAFFQCLKQAGLTAHNLAEAVIPPPHDEQPPRVLNIQECRALLGACAYSIRDRALIELLLATGITLSEVARLRIQDFSVDLYGSGGQLWVQGRGHKRRKLPLEYAVCHALETWLKVRSEIAEPALFVSKFEQPLGERSVQNIVRKYLQKARIDGASVSTLRHTYAVNELFRGTNLPTLQQRLGLANRQDVACYEPLAAGMRRRIH